MSQHPQQSEATAPPASREPLSSAAQKIMALEDGLPYTRLVVAGAGLAEAERALRVLHAPADLLARPVKSEEDARAMLAGLWLWHDWLEPAHQIAQQLPSTTGSFWHAIMHRREGDFSNSKYWYARSTGHPSLQVMGVQASSIINPMPADKSLLRLVWSGWSPEAFVDLVQEVHDRSDDPRHGIAVRLQQLEWRVLFDHCARQAVG